MCTISIFDLQKVQFTFKIYTTGSAKKTPRNDPRDENKMMTWPMFAL